MQIQTNSAFFYKFGLQETENLASSIKVTIFKNKDKLRFMILADSQIFIALFTALVTGILALRLGIALYK